MRIKAKNEQNGSNLIGYGHRRTKKEQLLIGTRVEFAGTVIGYCHGIPIIAVVPLSRSYTYRSIESNIF